LRGFAFDRGGEFDLPIKPDAMSYRVNARSGYDIQVTFIDMGYKNTDPEEMKRMMRQGPPGKMFDGTEVFYLYYRLEKSVGGSDVVLYAARGLLSGIVFGFSVDVPKGRSRESTEGEIGAMFTRLLGRMKLVEKPESR
jgi:hypothetical protein